MNHTMKHFAAFVIFTTLFLLVPFTLNAYAQTSKVKSADKEQLEVQTFVDSFNKSFEETKDLGQVPKNFFVADFKSHFANIDEWFDEFSDSFNQISDKERYEANVAMVNFLYLTMMTSEKNAENDEDINEMFPPEIVELIKKNRILRAIYDDLNVEEADSETKNVAELLELIRDTKTIADAIRKYLNENKTKWQSNYAKNITEARSQFAWYQTKLCEKEECANLPQKTKIVYYASFPFLYSIIKENNELRIFNIGILGN